jgi:hypothetical protein
MSWPSSVGRAVLLDQRDKKRGMLEKQFEVPVDDFVHRRTENGPNVATRGERFFVDLEKIEAYPIGGRDRHGFGLSLASPVPKLEAYR